MEAVSTRNLLLFWTLFVFCLGRNNKCSCLLFRYIVLCTGAWLNPEAEQVWDTQEQSPFLSAALLSSCNHIETSFLFLFKILFIVCLDRGREGEREGEKHQCVVASHASPTGDLACKPGMCPDWESNRGPLDSQAGAQSTEPHQPGRNFISLM